MMWQTWREPGAQDCGTLWGWKLSFLLVAQSLKLTSTPGLSSLWCPNNDCVLFKSTLGQPLSRRGSWKMPKIPAAKCNQLRHFQIVCDSDLHHHNVVFITIIIKIITHYYTCGHELAIAVRSWVRMIASVELSMSRREIFLVVERRCLLSTMIRMDNDMVATTRKLKMIITSNLPQAARKSVKPVREVCWGG